MISNPNVSLLTGVEKIESDGAILYAPRRK